MENRYFAQIFFLVLLGASQATVGCNSKVDEALTEVFSVAKPWRENVTINRRYVAQIRAIQHIEIRSYEKGYLQKVSVDEGQMVKTDDILFQVMPVLVSAESKKAQAEYDISMIEYNNTQKLLRQKVVSKNELALGKAKLDKSAAELSLANAHLALATIKAPFDGMVGRFLVRLGSLVGEGDLLTTLSDISKLWVYFNLSESDYLDYRGLVKGRSPASVVQLYLANGKKYDYPGQIDTIESDFDNTTGNVPFRATFPNPDLILRHGETGNVEISKTIDQALLIPQKATFELVDKRFVFVVNDKGVVDAREVIVEHEISNLFVIKSGLSEQDTVLLEGIGKLSKGKVIRTKMLTKADVVKGLELKAE
jgi:membrane fusion protein (multidrug efflux system)